EARAEHGLRLALLPVTLDDEARERPREEEEIVPVGHAFERREATHAVAAEFRLHVDVVDDLRREDGAPAEDCAPVGLLLADVSADGVVAVAGRHASPPRARASARPARGCRSCRAACRRRTSGTRAGPRAPRS